MGLEISITKKSLNNLLSLNNNQLESNPILANRTGKNLNIGCGGYFIDGFISLDIYTDYYHRNYRGDFIEYDLRKDQIPFDDESVDNIYISHVIEICGMWVNSIPELEYDGSRLEDYTYDVVCQELINNLTFRKEYPGDHINAWDFNRLKQIGEKSGFKHIIRSKPGASVSLAMQGSDIDRTHPQMTLYVDMVK